MTQRTLWRCFRGTLGTYRERFLGRHRKGYWGQEIGQLKYSCDKGLHSGPSAWGRICSVPCCACGVIFQESCFHTHMSNVAADEVSLFREVAKLVKKFVHTHRFKWIYELSSIWSVLSKKTLHLKCPQPILVQISKPNTSFTNNWNASGRLRH